MHLTALISLAAYAYTIVAAPTASLNWTIQRATNPTADQADAYAKIEAAMTQAVSRYAACSNCKKTIKVYYAPGVPTAEASFNGDLRFGSDRQYMTQRTAMHEISHTLGIGQTTAFTNKCASGDWKTALPLLKSWDGASAKINCGGGHFWPYGLNYETEWSETNAQRHVKMVEAMITDGLQG